MTKMTTARKSGNITTLADVKPLLGILYSASSASAMASALDRALRLTGRRSLSQIPANVTAWEDLAGTIVWTGEFSAPTLAKAKKNFDKFVTRISAIIRRAHEVTNPAAPAPIGVCADWDAVAVYVDDNPGLRGPDGRQVINSMSPVSVANLRKRLNGVSPQGVTTEVARSALIATPAGKRDSFCRAVQFFNGLIDTRDMHGPIAALLPISRIGSMPILRDAALDWKAFGPGFVESRDAAIEAAMRPEARSRGKDRFGGRLGRPALRGAGDARGRRRPVKNRQVAMRAHLAALSWLARHAYPDASAFGAMTDIEDLVTDENIERALRTYLERASASAVLKNGDETASLTTWLSNLATLARRGLRDDDLGWDIDEKKFEEGVDTYAAREMSAARAAFVRLIDYDPSVARTIVLAPQTLHAEAMRGIARWDEFGTNARIEVLHTLMAAAMWALQIGRPLRTRNLNELTHEGANPQINAPRSQEADPFMFISRAKVKNPRHRGPDPCGLLEDHQRLDYDRPPQIHRNPQGSRVCRQRLSVSGRSRPAFSRGLQQGVEPLGRVAWNSGADAAHDATRRRHPPSRDPPRRLCRRGGAALRLDPDDREILCPRRRSRSRRSLHRNAGSAAPRRRRAFQGGRLMPPKVQTREARADALVARLPHVPKPVAAAMAAHLRQQDFPQRGVPAVMEEFFGHLDQVGRSPLQARTEDFEAVATSRTRLYALLYGLKAFAPHVPLAEARPVQKRYDAALNATYNVKEKRERKSTRIGLLPAEWPESWQAAVPLLDRRIRVGESTLARLAPRTRDSVIQAVGMCATAREWAHEKGVVLTDAFDADLVDVTARFLLVERAVSPRTAADYVERIRALALRGRLLDEAGDAAFTDAISELREDAEAETPGKIAKVRAFERDWHLGDILIRAHQLSIESQAMPGYSAARARVALKAAILALLVNGCDRQGDLGTWRIGRSQCPAAIFPTTAASVSRMRKVGLIAGRAVKARSRQVRTMIWTSAATALIAASTRSNRASSA